VELSARGSGRSISGENRNSLCRPRSQPPRRASRLDPRLSSASLRALLFRRWQVPRASEFPSRRWPPGRCTAIDTPASLPIASAPFPLAPTPAALSVRLRHRKPCGVRPGGATTHGWRIGVVPRCQTFSAQRAGRGWAQLVRAESGL
jgi:hypothetical protein